MSNGAGPPPDDPLTNETLLSTVSDGIYQLDRNGHIVMVNDALLELTGYDRETVLGKHISHFLDTEDVVRAETVIRDHLIGDGQDSLRRTFPVFTATGETVPCEVRITAIIEQGEFQGTVGVVREVEDPDTAAGIQKAGERRQAFDALADASADGILLVNSKNIIQYANPAVERILGYTPDALTGEPLVTIIPDHLQQAHIDAFQEYLDTGEKHLDWTYIELPGDHSAGHEIPLGISFGEFIHDGVRYFTGIIRDISERKEAEEKLEQQNRRLDRFASMLAHELRNPLQMAQIYLDYIGDEDDSAPIDKIADALDRIDEIIEVLLMLAKGRDAVGDREAVGLTGVVADAWANTDTGQEEVKVTTSQILWVNPTHLQQLLENLFRNAIEHSDGPVTVRVGALDDGFYVEDTGPGIPEEAREKVVEAGYTTDEDGIGLGLTFVAQLADAYGWQYTITDSDEGGARFEFVDVEMATDERED